MKKILVTGGLGFIGSHTVVELDRAGFEVIIVDNLNNSDPNVHKKLEKLTGKNLKFYPEDIGRPAVLKTIFTENQGIWGVIHFAAHKAVGESVSNPLMYYQNNVGGLINLLQEMALAGIKDLVFSSSCTVYGNPEKLPVDEDTTIAGATSPYGNTKIICEQIIHDQAKTGALKSVNLRYFNPVGAHASAEIGELPLGIPNNLVPFITQTAAGMRKQLTVHGGDYNTPDGTCIRDYIHVVDLAIAHVKALYFLETQTVPTEYFNIGTGKGSSVLEVIKSFEKVSGLSLNYAIGPRRPGDVEQIWAATEKGNTLLGWTAERDLDAMMKDAWNWQKTLSE